MTRLAALALLCAGFLVQAPPLARAQERPAAPARIRVLLPAANARVWFDGQPTLQTGLDRLFASPPLPAGQKCSYTVRAIWLNNGHLIDVEKEAPIQSGQESMVDFRSPRRSIDPDAPLTPPIAPEPEPGKAVG